MGPRQNLASVSMVELARFESEQYWLHHINPFTSIGMRNEADTVVQEISRQREARGLWYQTMITRMPIFHELVIRTMAQNALAVEEAVYLIEYNYRCELENVAGQLQNRKVELRELKQALVVFWDLRASMASLHT